MIIPFDSMPDQSKVWVYQCSRTLTDVEKERMIKSISLFLDRWLAHGKELKAAVSIRYDQFLILAVDESENMATGCSIDSSVAHIKQLQDELGVDFFNRSEVAFKDGDRIQRASLKDFKERVKALDISPKAIVFNNAATSKHELDTKWEQPLAESWAGRFMPTEV